MKRIAYRTPALDKCDIAAESVLCESGYTGSLEEWGEEDWSNL